MKKILLFSCIVLQGFVCVAQSDCWETGSCLFGLLEPSDLRGIQRIEVRELVFRRIGKPKETAYGNVVLNSNGQVIEFRESYPFPLGKEKRYEHHQWAYDSAGVFLAEYVALNPGQVPVIYKDSVVHQNGRVLSRHFLNPRSQIFFETRYEWDSAGHLLRSWHYAGDSSQRNDANAKIEEYQYDEDGRVQVRKSQLGSLRVEYKLEYSGDHVYAFRSSWGAQPDVRDDIVLSAQGLPIMLTTHVRHGKKWRPVSQLNYVYQ